MPGMTTDSLKAGLERINRTVESCAEELNTLDGQLGDGDLGITMLRGTRAIADELRALPPDVGAALMKCAQAFTRTSGSTLGTLLATGLLSAARATRGRTEIPWSEISSLLDGAIQAMSQRGKSKLGDKTILDAFDAARRACSGLDAPSAMAEACNNAVGDAILSFRTLPCRQGRGRIFAEKSTGLDDPGMVAVKRLIEALLPESES